MTEELANCPVSGVTRIASGGRVEGSGRFKLSFSSKDPPSEVRFNCGLILQVRPYIPAPLRCRNCLAYRHHESSCSKPRRCNNCGLTGYLSRACQGPPCCAACGGPHAVTDSACQVFIRERDVNREIASTGCNRVAAEDKFPALPAPPSFQAPPPARASAPTPVSLSNSFAAVARAVPSSAPTPQNIQSSHELHPPSTMDVLAANLNALTAILNQLLEQNKAIISQNAGVNRLLSAPRLKQSTLAFTPISPRGPVTPKAGQATPKPVLEVGKKPKRRRSSDDQQVTDQLFVEQTVNLQEVDDQPEMENRPV